MNLQDCLCNYQEIHSWWMLNDPCNAYSPCGHSSCIETSRIFTLRVSLNYNSNGRCIIEDTHKNLESLENINICKRHYERQGCANERDSAVECHITLHHVYRDT